MAGSRYAELLDSIEAPQRSRRGSFEAVLGLADTLPRGRALDVPSGPGRMAEALSRLGFRAFAGDLDAAAFRPRGVRLCRLDLERPLPYTDAAFRFVYCGDGIEHLENPFALLRELARVLSEDGVLVIVTPNYLNVERRLGFLLTGSLAKPPRRVPDYHQGPRFDRGHINPLTLTRLAYMAECAGLALREARTLRPKRRQRWLAPLALLIRAYTAFLKPARRQALFARHTQSLAMLLGGSQLLAVFERRGKRLARAR